MSGSYLSYTSLLREGNVLVDMKTLSLPEDMHKFHLDDVYNTVSNIGFLYFYNLFKKCTHNSGDRTIEKFTRKRYLCCRKLCENAKQRKCCWCQFILRQTTNTCHVDCTSKQQFY